MFVKENPDRKKKKKKVVCKVTIKSTGEQDFSAEEVTNRVMSLKLVSSSFDVISLINH